MAHYQNGHPVYGQPNSPPASAAQPARYAASQNPTLRRMPSYDVGDDAALSAHNARTADVNGRYGGWSPDGYSQNQADPRYSQIPPVNSPQIPRSRGSSHSAYQYQYTSTLASPTQPAYNPQQYAVPPTPSQLGYNPSAYSGSGSAYAAGSAGGNAAVGHQPYNPAAYQPAVAYSQTPQTPLAYAPPHPNLPPPPPPRGTDHLYGGRPPPAGSYGFSASQSTLPSAYPLASPSTPSAAYAVSSTSHSPYLSQSPRRPESSLAAAVLDDQPPPPPAHATAGDDPFRKRLSFTRPGSGRSLPTPPTQHSQSPHSPRRAETLTRHPQARPLPGPPVDAEADIPSGANGAGSSPFADEADNIENAGVDRSLSGGMRQRIGPLHVDTQQNLFRGDGEMVQNDATGLRLSPDERHTHTNGNMATGTGQYVNYDAYSDDSDAEAAAGLAMLQMAEEEDKVQAERLQERSRRETNASIISAYASHPSGGAASPHPDTRPDDGIFYGSGYQRSHHGEAGHAREEAGYRPDRDRLMATSGSLRSSNVSSDDRAEFSDDYDYPPVTDDPAAYPFQPLPSHARVDAGGTGGLSEPGTYGRRMSFDYGEEAETPPIDHSHHSDSEGSERGDEPEDLFFHPGMRPLPPAPVEPANNARLLPHLMPAGTYRHAEQEDWQTTASQYTPSYLPVAADSYRPTVPASSQVPRSTSLSSHPIGPRTDPPIRSKTDADRAKYRQQLQQQQQELLSLRPESGALQLDAQTAAAMALDLPTIPAGRRKKFNPAKLSSEQFRRCSEPWALSAVLAWIRELSEDETDLKEQAIVDALVALFTHKVPTMNIADAETLAARVVSNMLAEEALVKEEEWVKFSSGSLSGVLFQITGTGCYSSLLHEQEGEAFGRCYSYHCMRTLKKVNLKAQMMEPQKKAEDWVTFYKVPKEVWESYPKKEIDRQNNLHEVVTTEDSFIGQLDVLRDLYRDQLLGMQPSIIPPKRLNKFLHDVFGKVDSVKRVNEDHLLAQLKYRQKEQGPFIVGFSDIFREWIRKAKSVYVDYAATFPYANYLVRKEAERNIHFRQFLNQARDHKLSNRLSWDTYLKAPITRIQRYTLLLSTVHKNMLKDSEEKTNVAQAIEEIKLVALECDNKVGEMSKKVDLMELSSKLQLRPEMKKVVELNLEHLGREIIFRGDLQRPGTRTRFLVDTHAILLDHYLVLAKAVTARDPSRTVKYESYDVSKMPIPMDLLVLESAHEDPVVKSSVRGVATVTPPQAATRGTGTTPSNFAPGGTSALVPTTVLESSKDDKILYPFKIKHLGTAGTYTLYAFSAQSRQDWCDKITEAKTKHAAALYTQNAEPFRLRVLADTAFANSDFSTSRPVTIDGTPLDRAIKEVELRYPANSPRPQPVCRTAVHCATVFQQPVGRMMCAIGTDYGVYISDYNDPRGWIRV